MAINIIKVGEKWCCSRCEGEITGTNHDCLYDVRTKVIKLEKDIEELKEKENNG